MDNTVEPTEKIDYTDNISLPTQPPPKKEMYLSNELLLQIISHSDSLDTYFRFRLVSPRFKHLVEDHFRRTYGPLMKSSSLSLRCTFIHYSRHCAWGACHVCLTGHGNELAPFTFHRLDGEKMVLRQAKVERWNHGHWGYSAGDFRNLAYVLRTGRDPRPLDRLLLPWGRNASRFLRPIWHFPHRHLSLFPFSPAEYRVLGFHLDPARREVSVNWMVLAALAFNTGNEGGLSRRPYPGGCYADNVFPAENCYAKIGYEWEGELQVWRGKADVPRWEEEEEEEEVRFPCERRPLGVVMAGYVLVVAIVAGFVGFKFWARCVRGVWKVVRWRGWL